MSVWTTLSESDTAEGDLVPGRRLRPDAAFSPFPGADPDPTMVDEPSEPPAAVGRRALREARRKRQLTAGICVVVIAVLLAISIMVVGFARDRPATPTSSGTAAGPVLSGLTPSL
jgi:hypothetical protein